MTFAEYRNDPEWQQAQLDFTDDERDGEDHDAVYVRRIKAASRMHDIETQYKARAES